MTEKLEQAIHEIEMGNKQAAVTLLAQVLKENPENEDAWVWMSEAVDDSIKKVECLEKVLEINPFNQDALRGLEHLRGETSYMRSDPFPFKADDFADEEQPSLTSEPFPEVRINDDGVAPVWKFGDPTDAQREAPASTDWDDFEPKPSRRKLEAETEESLPAAETPAFTPAVDGEPAPNDAVNIRDLISSDGETVPEVPVMRRERKPALLTPKQFKTLAIMFAGLLLILLVGGGWILYTIFR